MLLMTSLIVVAKYDKLIVKNKHVACFSMKQHFAFRKLNVPEIIQIATERSHAGEAVAYLDFYNYNIDLLNLFFNIKPSL